MITNSQYISLNAFYHKHMIVGIISYKMVYHIIHLLLSYYPYLHKLDSISQQIIDTLSKQYLLFYFKHCTMQYDCHFIFHNYHIVAHRI